MTTSKLWSPEFTPSYTPEEMLQEGVFEGKYINAMKGIPAAWKKLPKVVGPDDPPDASLNKYGIKSRQPLSAWKQNGWIKTDKEGWFGWYIRYYLGRRLGGEDDWQIGRWKSFVSRHMGQLQAGCSLSDVNCHSKQRQGLLQWGWDSRTPFNEKTKEKNLGRLLAQTGTSLESKSSTVLLW